MSKFGELIDVDIPVLLDFYTEWNEQSIAMHPVLRDVAAALGDKSKVLKIVGCYRRFCKLRKSRFQKTL